MMRAYTHYIKSNYSTYRGILKKSLTMQAFTDAVVLGGN